ncbi:glycosyl transferase possibly involved in lipopolysaccharide synthesis [Cylindrospermum stagnale PCC 7417]|uniref:Glycosyl transferase possibly involved in lipopolysaccharide synthesis n=1 Tax=Cylindrospermum stagnale PCC 7417 TaxID=56107 RepID=K9X525_9NOST|nr:heterocyst development glycosyltransferase HepC [Cylindrospermum stagnale]AFZ26762.1 glycosyl transferase possibly involved in lipopolysaccharide synthesis [Cylindrospermum stagnale PCC 7417]
MTTSIIPSLENNYTVPQHYQDHCSPYCTLQWRRGQLLVKHPRQVKQPYLPLLDREQSLVECLKHSPVNLVSIDPKLGEALLRFWADACEQANKPIFLSIPSGNKLPRKDSRLLRWFQGRIDWIAALVLLLVVSPVMLALILLMRMYSPGLLFSREWHVGERGKLFRAIKFRTTVIQDMTPLGHWLCKYGLENLPQLWNVIRGEMSLMGSRSWTLEDAVRLSSERQRALNQLPGITASWEVEEQSNILQLDS